MPRAPRTDRVRRPMPLARWDDDDVTAPDLVWWAQLDDRYLVEVVRARPGGDAALRIFDHARGDELVADRPVAVTGDGQFGPVIGDVVAWQLLATEIVDNPSRVDHWEGDLP